MRIRSVGRGRESQHTGPVGPGRAGAGAVDGDRVGAVPVCMGAVSWGGAAADRSMTVAATVPAPSAEFPIPARSRPHRPAPAVRSSCREGGTVSARGVLGGLVDEALTAHPSVARVPHELQVG